MWRRGSARIVRALAISRQALAADALAQPAGGPNTQLLPVLGPLARGFGTSSFWDVPHGSQASRQAIYIELHAVKGLLPNRTPFTPHFTPHGVMLMPNSSSMQLAAAPAPTAAAAEGEEEEVADEAGMWADSVKRKRKLKMKKHKLKKRRKLTRHQQ